MRKLSFVLLIMLIPIMAFGQLKEQAKLPAFSQVIAKPTTNFIFGFIDPEKFDMHHSFSMSYMTVGNRGLMVNSYMNTINYQISQPLMLRLNLGLMNSPYNSFNNPALNDTRFFGGAELLYRPTENSSIRLGVDYRPGLYNPYNYYNDPWYGW